MPFDWSSEVGLDSYSRRARLAPALLVLLPVGIAALAWFPGPPTWWQPLLGILLSCGVVLLLSQLGRDRGVRLEPVLFAEWGGSPTVRGLRHQGSVNAIALQRRHEKLRVLVPGIQLPTHDEETADSKGADQAYDACIAILREKTRDRKLFPLVFDENCNYGFRRNLLGLKWVGVTFAALGTVATGVLIILDAYTLRQRVPPSVVAAFVTDVLLLLVYALIITPSWVRIAAEGYAARLLAACEAL